MSIKKADSAGFCFGVNRAINIVNELLEKGIKVATLGPIIHNMEMVHELEKRGCTPVKAVDELTDDTTLVIRSHGVEKSVIDSLVKRGINFEDATCPFVKKIHKIVSNIFAFVHSFFIFFTHFFHSCVSNVVCATICTCLLFSFRIFGNKSSSSASLLNV